MEKRVKGREMGSVVEASTQKHVKDSGARTRKLEIVKVIPDEESEPTAEEQTEAKELQTKVAELAAGFGVSIEDPTENSLENLLTCLDPQADEYIQNHLKRLEELAYAAEYHTEDLPKVRRAVEAWEEVLASGRPVELVDDGLEVDEDTMIALRLLIENLKSDRDRARYQKVFGYLHAKNPGLLTLLDQAGDLPGV